MLLAFDELYLKLWLFYCQQPKLFIVVFLYWFGFIWLFLLVIYFQKNLRLECRSLLWQGEGTKKPSRGGLGCDAE